MKLNKYSWLAVLPMIFTACQEDTLMKEQQQDKVYTLSATMDGGAAMSRAQIVIGNDAEASEGETFMWNEGDSFVMYQSIDEKWNKSTFNISGYSEDNSSTSATFKADKAATAGAGYIAFYPADRVSESGEFSHWLPNGIEFSNDKTFNEVWADYFITCMPMIAENSTLDVNSSLEFKHLCALARISYTNKTGKPLPITRFYLKSSERLFGDCYSYYVPDKTGNIVSSQYEIGLDVEGLTVDADKTVDLYLLFFPKEFGNSTSLSVGIEHQSMDWFASLDISAIAEANENATGFEAGKRYWFNVTETLNGLVWDKSYQVNEMEVSSYEELNIARNTESVTHILLKNPIIFTDDLSNLNIYLNNKTVTMSDDFSWSVDGVEHDALFVNCNSYIRFSDGRIEALEDVEDGKYLFSSNFENSSVGFSDIDMAANGKMNAIKVENASEVSVFSDNISLIDVEDGYAFSITSSKETQCSVFINVNGTIKGDIYYENNYTEAGYPSNFRLWNGIINGDIVLDGDYSGYLFVEINKNAVANGNGWIAETMNINAVKNGLANYLAENYSNFAKWNEDNTSILINKDFVETMSSLDIQCRSLSDLSGIEYFKNLVQLNCNDNNLTALDLSDLTQLEKIECNNNNDLTSLILPSSITHIECENNSLSELDLTHCTSEAIYILCGRQGESTGDNLTITLKLTDAMKTYWKTNLYNKGNNGVRVKIDGDTSVQAPSLENKVW